MITAAGVTHPGRVRPINEDTFLCDLENGLFVVGDGMGGHHAGEVASNLAVESIRTFLTRTRDGEEMTWPYGINPELSFDGNRIMTAIKLANRRVFKAGESREDYSGMGTTIVVALATAEGRLVFASVGDSRIYSFAAATLTQLTQDDSWVSMMLGKDNVDPGVLARHPMKHVLTNVIGARDQLEFKVTERPLDREELFLLSTDGLHGALEAPDIVAILGSGQPPDALADRLVQAALERGGSDNITALVVRHQP
jgi:protein phosphatase